MNTRLIGARGEKRAALHLWLHGYRVLEKNFHFGREAEIDLIARKRGVTVFVEVKARSGEKYGSGREAVTRQKREHIRLAAEYYRQKHGLTDQPCRFDVIELADKDGRTRLTHIENAF